jgi:hypothetical protein
MKRGFLSDVTDDTVGVIEDADTGERWFVDTDWAEGADELMLQIGDPVLFSPADRAWVAKYDGAVEEQDRRFLVREIRLPTPEREQG